MRVRGFGFRAELMPVTIPRDRAARSAFVPSNTEALSRRHWAGASEKEADFAPSCAAVGTASEMNAGRRQDDDGRPAPLPAWDDCDFFCIHDYAGTGNSPCGWRGRRQDARRDAATLKLLCPWCGCATLLRIPLDRTDEEGN